MSELSTVRLGNILMDLDRCEHGRHSVDPCLACPGGRSTGNLLLPPGTVIGYSQSGHAITVPEPHNRYDWKAWRR
jgi:hypothetical protein